MKFEAVIYHCVDSDPREGPVTAFIRLDAKNKADARIQAKAIASRYRWPKADGTEDSGRVVEVVLCGQDQAGQTP